jgi:hypothetical protein
MTSSDDDKRNTGMKPDPISSLPRNLVGLVVGTDSAAFRISWTASQDKRKNKLVFTSGDDLPPGTHFTIDFRWNAAGGLVEGHLSNEQKKQEGAQHWTPVFRLDFGMRQHVQSSLQKLLGRERRLWKPRLLKTIVPRTSLASTDLLAMPVRGEGLALFFGQETIPVRKRKARLDPGVLSSAVEDLLAKGAHRDQTTVRWEDACIFFVPPGTESLRLVGMAMAVPEASGQENVALLPMDMLWCMFARHYEAFRTAGVLQDKEDCVRRMIFEWTATEAIVQKVAFSKNSRVEVDERRYAGTANVIVSTGSRRTLYAIRYSPTKADMREMDRRLSDHSVHRTVLVVPERRPVREDISALAEAAAIRIHPFDPCRIPRTVRFPLVSK